MKQRPYKELTPIDYDDLLLVMPFRHTGRRERKVCFPRHYHERMELLRVLRGRMDVHIDDERFEAQAGDLIIINPNQAHTAYGLTDNVDYDMIAFELVSLNNNSFSYQKYLEPLVNHRIVFGNVTSHHDVLRLADELIRSYGQNKDVHPLHKVSMIYHILGSFYQHCPTVEHPTAGRVNMDSITGYIDEHFNEPLSVREISRKFGYNENYFSRMFKKNTKMSVVQYIQALRMERAKKLLRETDESITAVALLCGYTDVSYFSNRFKQHTGEAPRQYRGRHHKRAWTKEQP